jgi:hypothetical protein
MRVDEKIFGTLVGRQMSLARKLSSRSFVNEHLFFVLSGDTSFPSRAV